MQGDKQTNKSIIRKKGGEKRQIYHVIPLHLHIHVDVLMSWTTQNKHLFCSKESIKYLNTVLCEETDRRLYHSQTLLGFPHFLQISILTIWK